jgi:hypothetical protein
MGRPSGKPSAWQPVQIKKEFTVVGGFLKRPQVLPTKVFHHDGVPVEMIRVGSAELWLCSMAAGECAAKRPLGRVQVFKKLWAGLFEDKQGGPAIDAKMQALDFEDGDGASSGTSPDGKRPAKMARSGPCVRAVSLSTSASAAAETVEVVAARLGSKLFIATDALSWLVNYLRDELATCGVEPVASAAAESPPNIWWDFHNSAWVAYSQPEAAGKRVKLSKGVRCRRASGGDLAGFTFEDAKQKVYEELLAEVGGDPRTQDAEE